MYQLPESDIEMQLLDVRAKKPKLNGCYVLKHTQSGCVYVGSTEDLFSCYQEHLADLRQGVHANTRFQKLYQTDPAIEIKGWITDTYEYAHDIERDQLDNYRATDLLLNDTADTRVMRNTKKE